MARESAYVRKRDVEMDATVEAARSHDRAMLMLEHGIDPKGAAKSPSAPTFGDAARVAVERLTSHTRPRRRQWGGGEGPQV